jgi:hypothetical protein
MTNDITKAVEKMYSSCRRAMPFKLMCRFIPTPNKKPYDSFSSKYMKSFKHCIK